MAEENQSKDIFKSLLKLFYELIKPGLDILKDGQARTELLSSLGMQNTSSTSAPATPPANNLEEYVNSQSEEEDVDIVQLASALIDLTLIMTALEGFFEAAKSDDDERTASELVSAFINLLALDYVRRRAPGLHGFINLLSVVDNTAAAQGGSVNLFKDVIWGFFERLGSGIKNFDTEEDAAAVSDTIFLLIAGLLFGLDIYLKGKDINTVEIRSGYGYEGFPSSPTPNADRITNRAMSYSVSITPLDALHTTLYNTLVFVPKSQGGLSLVTNLSGVADYTIDISEDKSIRFDAAGQGIFRIGEGAEAEAGPNNRLAITFKHKRENPEKWAMLDKPVVKFAIGTYQLILEVKPDDLAVKLKFDLYYQFGRGDLSGFPFDFIPEDVNEKTAISFGYSLKSNNFSFDGNGSTGTGSGSGGGSGSRAIASRDLGSDLINTILNAINLRIPIHKDIGGIIGFETIYIKTGVSESFSAIELESSVDFWLKLGPAVTISISRLGLLLKMNKREDSGGIGGYDLVPAIKPPNGAGIRINAAVITGGGFLFLDSEKGEYFGALELSFKNMFALKAVGIINTKMPDGSDGFSLLILITAEFEAFQLGFGFTLLGVGGLLGLNRSINVEALREGLRTNAIKSILFPEDVVGNIHRIISDIKQIFPIKDGQFVIGLMAKIGWGTPTLISIELGLLLEIPDPRIVILGVIKTILPDEAAPLLKIQVNFLGVIDFQNNFIYFEARLFESSLVGFPLTGSMAFAVGWGSQSVFAISVGGFHPDFKDYPSVPTLPGAFRDMERISLQLLSGPNPRLGIECYFAVTSNSVQFGAKAELYAEGPMGFNLWGLLAFDALFIFDPFSFVISLEAALAIRRGSSVIMGIHFRGKLSGPNPWHVEGEVSFSVLFFDVTIGFSATWGDPPPALERPSENLLELLTTELGDNRNWQVEIPDYHNLHVTLRQLPEGEQPPLLVHPFGGLNFSQRSFPLDYTLQKRGQRKPLDVNFFSITEVKVGDQVLSNLPAEKELFAPGEYTDLSENEKLSRKSFEYLNSGVKLSDTGKLLTAPPQLAAFELNYELNYTYDDGLVESQVFALQVEAFNVLKRSAAASKSNLSWHQLATPLNSPEKVNLAKGDFAIASTIDLRDMGQGFRASSQAEAGQFFAQLIAENPELVGEVQIVESFELAF